MRKVYLDGPLGEEFGKEWDLDISNPVEAIAAIQAQRRGFRKFLIDSAGIIGYEIMIGDDDGIMKDDPIEKMYINDTTNRDIRIVPVIEGSKSKAMGFLMVIVGVVLTVMTGGAALGFSGPALGAFGTGGALAGWAGVAGMLGAGLIFGGISMMMMPDVDQGDTAVNAENYLFNGPINTVRQGTPIPLVYGRMITGSVVVSGSLFTETSRTEIDSKRKLVGISNWRTPGSTFGVNHNTFGGQSGFHGIGGPYGGYGPRGGM